MATQELMTDVVIPTPEVIEEIKREDYLNVWLEIFPTKTKGQWDFGSMHLTKMMLFLAKAKPTPEDIAYWTSIENWSLARKEDEPYESYRLRRVFIDKLNKFRGKINGILFLLNIQRFQAIQKEEKLKEELRVISFQNQLNNK